jgi:hypothetical protein
MAASSVAMVAGGLLAVGGASTALASQVRTEHVILFHNGRTDTTMTVSPDSCSYSVHSGVYFSAYNYWTDKAYFNSNTCGYGVEAAIECSGHWLYGSAVYGVGSSDASFAACNKTYPTYDTFGFVLLT